MPVITALWARSAVASSAIIWRTKRRKSSRRARRTLHPLLLRRAPTDRRARASRLVVERGFGLRIERPARPARSVEPVDHPEPQALNARPGDHRAVVGAKLGGRRAGGRRFAGGRASIPCGFDLRPHRPPPPGTTRTDRRRPAGAAGRRILPHSGPPF